MQLNGSGARWPRVLVYPGSPFLACQFMRLRKWYCFRKNTSVYLDSYTCGQSVNLRRIPRIVGKYSRYKSAYSIRRMKYAWVETRLFWSIKMLRTCRVPMEYSFAWRMSSYLGAFFCSVLVLILIGDSWGISSDSRKTGITTDNRMLIFYWAQLGIFSVIAPL